MEDQTQKFRLHRDPTAVLCRPFSSIIGVGQADQQRYVVLQKESHTEIKTSVGTVGRSSNSGSIDDGSGEESSMTNNIPSHSHPQRASHSTALHWREGFDHYQESLRHELWENKNMLNSASEEAIMSARNRIFPIARSGGRKGQFSNRAGYKLAEVMDAVGIWAHLHPSTGKKKGETDAESDSPPTAASTSSPGLLRTSESSSDVVTKQKVPLPAKSRGGGGGGGGSVFHAFSRLVAEDAKEKLEREKKKEKRERELLQIKTNRKKRKNDSSSVITFVDLCGGPGAFSEYLLSEGRRRRHCMRGYGMTLKDVDVLDWYPWLSNHSDSCSSFVITYGPDGTGNIFNLQNVDSLVSIAGEGKIALVVGDGGFTVKKELQNYQETISLRITYAQWLAALKLQSPGGCFVLKLFDTFSPFTRAMLYLSTFMYREVWIVKPSHSRMINSERYLVCIEFEQAHNSSLYSSNLPEMATEKKSFCSEWMPHFERCFLEGFVSDEYCVPTILLSSEVVTHDEVFMKDLSEMNSTIARHQIEKLRLLWKELQPEEACSPRLPWATASLSKSDAEA